jgi:hypothetical protein
LWELALGKLGFGPEEDALNGRIPAVFQSLQTKDGSATTAVATLVFDKDIEGLSADDLTLDAGTTGAMKGKLSRTGFGTYSLALSGVKETGTMAVSVARDGYAVLPSTQKAQAFFVNPVIAVDFLEVKANGVPNTDPTTALTLTFSQAIEGLSAGDIAVEGDGFTKGALSPAGGGVYTLALSDVTAQSTVMVSAAKDGYAISSSSSVEPVTVSYPLKLTSVTANGEVGAQSTTQLELTFDRDIAWSVPVSITVTGTGLSAGSLGQTDDPKIYTLPVSGVTKEETVNVSVKWNGYATATNTVTVVYHKDLGTLVAGKEGSPSIKEKFGVTTEKRQGVEDTFKELSAFIKNGGLTANSGVVKTGDYIDLEDGLTVAANDYGGGFTFGGNDTATDGSKLLRLIVVGVNSFQKVNLGDNATTQHVVFQFQNIPIRRRMHQNTDKKKYSDTNMVSYLEENFYTGLKAAGVPEGVVWAPARNLGNWYKDSDGVEKQSYNIWLPTERELGVTSNNKNKAEIAANQALLEYYTSNDNRIKHFATGKANSFAVDYYWTASPASGSGYAAYISPNGTVGSIAMNAIAANDDESAIGVVPAFCVGPGSN